MSSRFRRRAAGAPSPWRLIAAVGLLVALALVARLPALQVEPDAWVSDVELSLVTTDGRMLVEEARLTFVLGEARGSPALASPGERLPAGLERVLLELKPGQEREGTLDAESLYGVWEPERVFTIERSYAMPNPLRYPLSELSETDVEGVRHFPLEGGLVRVRVIEQGEDDALIEWLVEEPVELPGHTWPALARLGGDSLVVTMQPQVGVRYGGTWDGLLVTGLSDDGIVVDANGPLAGEALQYRVKLIERRAVDADTVPSFQPLWTPWR